MDGSRRAAHGFLDRRAENLRCFEFLECIDMREHVEFFLRAKDSIDPFNAGNLFGTELSITAGDGDKGIGVFPQDAPHELAALYVEMEEKLLWEWKAPIVNDFFVMVFYGTLKRLCASWCGDESGWERQRVSGAHRGDGVRELPAVLVAHPRVFHQRRFDQRPGTRRDVRRQRRRHVADVHHCDGDRVLRKKRAVPGQAFVTAHGERVHVACRFRVVAERLLRCDVMRCPHHHAGPGDRRRAAGAPQVARSDPRWLVRRILTIVA